MKKKKIIIFILIFVLISTAFGVPLAINFYNDMSVIDKVQYVDSKDVDVASFDTGDSVATNLEILNEHFSTDIISGYVELNFEPSKEKLKEIYSKIGNEISQWFDKDIMDLEQLGIQLNLLSEFAIEDIRLFSIDKVSFFDINAQISGSSDTSIRIVMDSEYYKIYSVTIYGGIAGKISNIYEYNVTSDYSNKLTSNIAKKLGQYYEINEPKTIKISEGERMFVTYGLLPMLDWSINFYHNGDEPTIEIGIINL